MGSRSTSWSCRCAHLLAALECANGGEWRSLLRSRWVPAASSHRPGLPCVCRPLAPAVLCVQQGISRLALRSVLIKWILSIWLLCRRASTGTCLARASTRWSRSGWRQSSTSTWVGCLGLPCLTLLAGGSLPVRGFCPSASGTKCAADAGCHRSCWPLEHLSLPLLAGPACLAQPQLTTMSAPGHPTRR